jgi:hypothetical protein
MQLNFEVNTIEYLERRKAIAKLANSPFADRIAAAIEVLKSPIESGLGPK